MSTNPTRTEGRPSLRTAIDAKCKSCIYDPLSGMGNWRQQVAACTVTRCPLYAVRPVSAPKVALKGRPADGAPGSEADGSPHVVSAHGTAVSGSRP
jgi:hypothetical protein